MNNFEDFDENEGEFEDFNDFDDFIDKIRQKIQEGINKEEEIFEIPLILKIQMSIPIDLGLILNGIMYTKLFKN